MIHLNEVLLESIESKDDLIAAKEKHIAVALEVQNQFLSHISHEFRTPLGNIISIINLISVSTPADSLSQYLLLIEKSSTSLLMMLNDIFDLIKYNSEDSKIDIRLSHDEIHAFEFFHPLVCNASLSAFEKGLDLIYRVDPSISKSDIIFSVLSCFVYFYQCRILEVFKM